MPSILMHVLTRSQQWGSPLLPWFIVELAGLSVCLAAMPPAGIVLGALGYHLFGEVGAGGGLAIPAFVGIEMWSSIKRRLKDQ
jgi:hypothetical protein